MYLLLIYINIINLEKKFECLPMKNNQQYYKLVNINKTHINR